MDGSLFPDFEFFSQEEDVLLAVRETALMHPPRPPCSDTNSDFREDHHHTMNSQSRASEHHFALQDTKEEETGSDPAQALLSLPGEWRNKPDEFRCQDEGCKKIYFWHGPLHLSRAHVAEKELWKTIFEAACLGRDSCRVKCLGPKCRQEHLQCTHCNKSILVHNNIALKSQTRTSNSAMKKHLTRCTKCKSDKETESQDDARRQTTDADELFLEPSAFDEEGDNFAVCWDEASDAIPELMHRDYSDSSDSEVDSVQSTDDFFLDVGASAGALHAEALLQERKERIESEALEGIPQLDLDPDSMSDDEEIDDNQSRVPSIEHAEAAMYQYSDFSFLDWRTNPKLKHKLCQTQLYFYQKYVSKCEDPNDDTGGFRGLVHRASEGDREDASKIAPKRESCQFFRLFNLHNLVPGSLKSQVIGLHQGAKELWNTAGRADQSVETKFPSDDVECRNMLEEGHHSVYKNFPVPQVFEISDHACVSMKQVILISAGHGADFNFGYDAAKRNEDQNREGLNGTRAFKALVDEVRDHQQKCSAKANKIGYIYLWSDSFLNCFVKQKDNSVWIITLTICPPENKKSSGKYTHVLAIGRSSANHTKVFERYLDEIRELMDGFDCYFGMTNQICRVAFGLLTLNGDRPERQAVGQTKKEGHYGKVSGMAAPVDEKKLPSCDKCLSRRVKTLLGTPPRQGKCCSECFDWKMEESEAQRTVKVMAGHPCRRKQPEEGWLSENTLKGRELGRPNIGPVKLTREWLEKALEVTYIAVLIGEWTPAAADKFLTSCNVATNIAKFVADLALDDRKHGRMSGTKQHVPKIWKLPGLFDRFKLPDLPMHALAHGIITDTMNIFHQIFARYKKFEAFLWFANPVLEDVSSMRLDYCKVKSLPKAAWVGENVMGYTRLLSYLYGGFLSVTPLKSEEDDITRNIVVNMKLMLNSLQSLMSILMNSHQVNVEARDRETEKSVDNHMKLLMSTADRLHNCVGTIPSKQRASKKAKHALLRGVTKGELMKILETFELQTDNGSQRVDDLRKSIMKIKKSDLVTKSNDFGLVIAEKTLIDDVRKAVFEHILDKPLAGGETEEAAEKTSEVFVQDDELNLQDADEAFPQDMQCSHQELGLSGGEAGKKGPFKEQTRCWNKGNWLSFTANIAAQTYFLGCLLLLW